MAMQTERLRRLAWEGCLNSRDLGGYPTVGGRETRWGAIVRSDALAYLTEAGRGALVEYGARSIIDLRTPDELEQFPNPFAQPGAHGVAYIHISLLDPSADPPEDVITLVESYKRMLDRFRPSVGAIMRAIAQAPAGGVVVHCMGGKDRTGLVCALLLDLAGVRRETIAADYALTTECLRPRDEEWLANGPGERADREQQLERYMARAEVMLEVLEHLDGRYGGVAAYLLGIGVTPEEIASLRERLLPSTPDEA